MCFVKNNPRATSRATFMRKVDCKLGMATGWIRGGSIVLIPVPVPVPAHIPGPIPASFPVAGKKFLPVPIPDGSPPGIFTRQYSIAEISAAIG